MCPRIVKLCGSPSGVADLAAQRLESKESAWRQRARALAEFMLPRVCAACEEGLDDSDTGLICGRCWSRVSVLSAPRCDRCGHPTKGDAECSVCELLPPWVRSARSFCWLPQAAGTAILSALKYEGWEGVAPEIAERLARLDWPVDVVAERAALVPVPLAAVKERERGFNQAALIARGVGSRLGIPVWEDVVERTRATPSQTRLTPGERLANVHGAFLATPQGSSRIQGCHIILVDDVLTTGATLNACASVLFAAGARTFSYLTFGRARASGDL